MSFEKDLVSIIIPCFRSEAYLEETLQSVSQQTHTHWELIVVEDGSQDSTEKIVQEFKKKHPDHLIQYLRQPETKGPSAARNLGIQKAKGVWVALLDSDDLWNPAHLGQSIAVLKKENTDLSYCTLDLFDSETKALCGQWGPTPEDLNVFPKTLFLRNFIAPSSVLIRANVFNQFQFDESPLIQSCEDHDLWMTLLKNGYRFSWISGLKVNYRKHHLGAATANKERTLRADLEVMRRQWRNPCFDFQTKCRGLSDNYALLAEALLKKGQWGAPFYLLRSWFLNPAAIKYLKRSIKTAWLLTSRSFA